MLGAVSLVGLSELLPKGMALGRLPPDHPEALSRRAVALGRFLVQGVYVMWQRAPWWLTSCRAHGLRA